MRHVADFARASGTFYFVADQQKGTIVHSELEGVDPSANQQYLDYYGSKDLRLGPALTFPVARPFTGDMLVDRQAFEKSEIFGALLAPFDIPHILGMWVDKRPLTASAIILERSFRQGAFERRDIERCSMIMPHVLRAVRTREALARAKQQHRIYVDLLDRLPFGTILLGHSLQVIEMSAAARAILDEQSALSCCGGRIRALASCDDTLLQSALGAALAPGTEAIGHSLRLNRVAGGDAIGVTVVPVSSPAVFADVCPAVVLLLFDPAAVPAPTTLTLRLALGLTEAEAALVTVLFGGVTLREAAEQLGVSINTGKSQLKSIYAKTGCRSHGDLAKGVLMTALGTVRTADCGVTGLG